MRFLPRIAGACLLALSLCAQAEAEKSSPAAVDAIDASTSAVLRGDSAQALQALRAAPERAFSRADADYRACMFGRFDRAAPPYLAPGVDDAFVGDVLRRYQRYWWRALAAPPQRDALAGELERDLRAMLGAAGRDAADMTAVEAALAAELKRRGYHAQLGRTPPLRELMLWRRQDTRFEDVELPEGPQRVRVELLDEFVSRGWSSYARCERGSAGGWATKDALYAIVPAYRKEGLDSELFRVVFLGHEAQHFADQNRYPGIAPWELEYRAKLVELAQAREVSGKRLRGFVTAQSDDPDSPHTYANKRVIAALTARLGRSPEHVPIDALQAAALAELRADSRRRDHAR